MKNFSRIKNQKDLVTKEYVDKEISQQVSKQAVFYITVTGNTTYEIKHNLNTDKIAVAVWSNRKNNVRWTLDVAETDIVDDNTIRIHIANQYKNLKLQVVIVAGASNLETVQVGVPGPQGPKGDNADIYYMTRSEYDSTTKESGATYIVVG